MTYLFDFIFQKKEELEKKAQKFSVAEEESKFLENRIKAFQEEMNNVDHVMEDSYKAKQWFTAFKTMRKDEAFGELALIKDIPRAATILCTEDCAFAVMNKYNYDRSMSKITVKTKQKINDFL